LSQIKKQERKTQSENHGAGHPQERENMSQIVNEVIAANTAYVSNFGTKAISRCRQYAASRS